MACSVPAVPTVAVDTAAAAAPRASGLLSLSWSAASRPRWPRATRPGLLEASGGGSEEESGAGKRRSPSSSSSPGEGGEAGSRMVDPDKKDAQGVNLPSRTLHIIGPDKKVKLSFLYPACTGRNMDEVARAVDSLLTAAKHKVATSSNWKPGECVVIQPGVSDEEAKKLFPQGFQAADLPSKKGYLRSTKV